MFANVGHVYGAEDAQLSDGSYVEHILMPLVGMDDSDPQELPLVVLWAAGGLRVRQYPCQFAPYLVFLARLRPQSYMEIGCGNGGTFALTTAYLRRTGSLRKGVAVDVADSPVASYCLGATASDCDLWFVKQSCDSEAFKQFMLSNAFDVVFIGSDPGSVEFVCARVLVFFGIFGKASEMWLHLRRDEPEQYLFYEFTGQYAEVLVKNGGRPCFGIGVAVTVFPPSVA